MTEQQHVGDRPFARRRERRDAERQAARERDAAMQELARSYADERAAATARLGATTKAKTSGGIWRDPADTVTVVLGGFEGFGGFGC